MRLVLDTNVVVAGLRSPTGASAELLDRALTGAFTLLVSVALALEYEAVCGHADQRIASGLSETDVETIVTALCAVAEPVATRFLWRPQLRDPADEMVLEAAINGAADALATFNRRDFGQAPARFGIVLVSPQEALRRLPS
ncbi:MAG: putative toxin-antitoxin system toxin component, PIN family [Acidobacteria bacterium]|nr:putative toxin-antitoxin system toxin component, PIN family [Acidobacteriota bacterium]MYH28697.1 putative toxin-antitoxin system toxin component, PIN family [Acidobacteriota bacterium]